MKKVGSHSKSKTLVAIPEIFRHYSRPKPPRTSPVEGKPQAKQKARRKEQLINFKVVGKDRENCKQAAHKDTAKEGKAKTKGSSNKGRNKKPNTNLKSKSRDREQRRPSNKNKTQTSEDQSATVQRAKNKLNQLTMIDFSKCGGMQKRRRQKGKGKKHSAGNVHCSHSNQPQQPRNSNKRREQSKEDSAFGKNRKFCKLIHIISKSTKKKEMQGATTTAKQNHSPGQSSLLRCNSDQPSREVAPQLPAPFVLDDQMTPCQEVIQPSVNSKSEPSYALANALQAMQQMQSSSPPSLTPQCTIEEEPPACLSQFKLLDFSFAFRAGFLDLMSIISERAGLQRETFHHAVDYFDKLITSTGIEKQKFRPISQACLAIAARVLEEKHVDCPSQAESFCLRMVQFRAGKTLFTLSLAVAQNWDYFICSQSFKQTTFGLAQKHHSQNALCFKNESNAMLRSLVQLADAALYHQQSLPFARRKVVASILYLLLRHRLQDPRAPLSALANQFNRSTRLFVDKLCFNEAYNQFLGDGWGMELADIISCIKSCSRLLQVSLRGDGLCVHRHLNNPRLSSPLQ